MPALDLWILSEKGSTEVIGHCGLTDKEIDGQKEVELVYVIAKAHWSKGYATEIARSLVAAAGPRFGLKRLVSLIDPANEGSERVALNAGLSFEKSVDRPNGKRMKLYAVSIRA